jgi:two-component system LytT family response regulator
MRVLIVDDEPLARQRLEDLLLRHPDMEIAGTAGSGAAAVAAIRAMRPDLVCLDVQMPGKSGIDVLREVGSASMPATIFVTAYDQYALHAFELAAIDYLVKPFDDERFELALARARQVVALEQIGRRHEQLLAVLQAGGLPTAPGRSGPSYLERIAVEMKGKVRVVPTAEVECIVASGPYAELHVGDRRYVIREAMQTLEERLDPERFMRIHRSVIVRLDTVVLLLRSDGRDWEVQLRSGARLRVSRTRRDALERRLGILQSEPRPPAP